MDLTHSALGKKSAYIEHYQPELLYPIPRKTKRDELCITEPLPFNGYDLWNAYEISWLNDKGKPVVALAVIIVPANSPCLIESKSLKLYFNSFNQSVFSDQRAVEQIMSADLSQAAGAPVDITLSAIDQADQHFGITTLSSRCIDDLDIQVQEYKPEIHLLSTEKTSTTESIHSHLLKSNCLVTGQPDWGTVQITYSGQKINHEGLLHYLIGFRQHNEFHEQCVERIFIDIMRQCQPKKLSVYARYTRRGGIDINPYRTTEKNHTIENPRLVRQ